MDAYSLSHSYSHSSKAYALVSGNPDFVRITSDPFYVHCCPRTTLPIALLNSPPLECKISIWVGVKKIGQHHKEFHTS